MTALTRRQLLRAGAAAAAPFALGVPAAQARARPTRRPVGPTTARSLNFNQGWRFNLYRAGAENPAYNDQAYERIVLPHTVTRLSWGDWNPAAWEQLWIYRKRFSATAYAGARVLVDFDAVMANATVYLNGVPLAEHLGGYLPFSVELTDDLIAGENELAVVVDGRLLDVPPLGNLNGPAAVDYLQPAGIHRDVTLRVLPTAYISDVFAKPLDVLSGSPTLELDVAIDSSARLSDRVALKAELLRGGRRIATLTTRVSVGQGTTTETITLRNLHPIELWSPDSPSLYTARVTLTSAEVGTDAVEVTTGFRQATFTTEGLFLNGERLQIFGLNHHGLFPYTGMAAPLRMHARDAAFLKYELNVNMVRCSHYPQSPHFLDACDQLGIMVWEEPAGWQYVGDADFEAIFLQNVHDMVVRDRNRPSVIVWGTRLNETSSYPTLYAQARQLAYALDGTRQTSGAMDAYSTTGWSEDVFAYDDYETSNGNAALKPPIPGIPYMVSETVGALEGQQTFRWIDSSAALALQAEHHAQAHEIGRTSPGYCGVIAWCGIDYASLDGGGANWNTLKTPGVLDTFRVPKPGAAFYRSQLSPARQAVIIPAFYWDFGPQSPPTGPGPGTILATNCDTLAVYVGGSLLTTATPDTADYGHLSFPPVLVDLTVDGSSLPQLTVLGYVGGRQVAALNMSASTAGDRLVLDLEDSEIVGDGTDATRLTFRALDAFGNQRPYPAGNVTLTQTGSAAHIVGQNPFAFQEYGGVGGVFVRSVEGRHGAVGVTASHPTLGSASVSLTVVAPPKSGATVTDASRPPSRRV